MVIDLLVKIFRRANRTAADLFLFLMRNVMRKKKKKISEEIFFPQYSSLLPGYMRKLLETMLPNKGTYYGVINSHENQKNYRNKSF